MPPPPVGVTSLSQLQGRKQRQSWSVSLGLCHAPGTDPVSLLARAGPECVPLVSSRVGQRGSGLSMSAARSEHEVSEIIDGLSEQEVSPIWLWPHPRPCILPSSVLAAVGNRIYPRALVPRRWVELWWRTQAGRSLAHLVPVLGTLPSAPRPFGASHWLSPARACRLGAGGTGTTLASWDPLAGAFLQGPRPPAPAQPRTPLGASRGEPAVVLGPETVRKQRSRAVPWGGSWPPPVCSHTGRAPMQHCPSCPTLWWAREAAHTGAGAFRRVGLGVPAAVDVETD